MGIDFNPFAISPPFSLNAQKNFTNPFDFIEDVQSQSVKFFKQAQVEMEKVLKAAYALWAVVIENFPHNCPLRTMEIGIASTINATTIYLLGSPVYFDDLLISRLIRWWDYNCYESS